MTVGELITKLEQYSKDTLIVKLDIYDYVIEESIDISEITLSLNSKKKAFSDGKYKYDPKGDITAVQIN